MPEKLSNSYKAVFETKNLGSVQSKIVLKKIKTRL
jgi:hypothetical protein